MGFGIAIGIAIGAALGTAFSLFDRGIKNKLLEAGRRAEEILGQRLQFGRIAWRHILAERKVRQGPVHRAGVKIRVPEFGRQ